MFLLGCPEFAVKRVPGIFKKVSKMKTVFLFLAVSTIALAGLKKFPHQDAKPNAALLTFPDVPVCFSPDENCNKVLTAFLAGAEKSIDVAIYDLNDPMIALQLTAKAKKVKVRVVCDAGESKGSHSLVSQLVRDGVDVRYGRQKGIMHDKFTVVDGIVLETGSFNYTTRAVKSNQENQVYLKEPVIVSGYVKRFDFMWKNAKPVKKVSR